MKVLFITTLLPHLKSSGGEIATSNFLNSLGAAGCDCTVVGYLRAGDPAPEENLNFKIAGERPIETTRSGIKAYYWLLKSFFFRRPYSVEKYVSTSMRNAIKQCLQKNQYDLLIIDHSQMGWVTEIDGLPNVKILIAHNYESKLYNNLSEGKNSLRKFVFKRESRLIKKIEMRLMNETTQVWTVSREEAEEFNDLTENKISKSFPLPGPPLPIDPNPADIQFNRDIGLLGAWTYEANRAGLIWFLQEVVPHLDSNLSIGIAGKGTDSIEESRANIHLEGFVDDAVTFFRSSRIVAIPTVSGAGVQIRSILAIGSGAKIVGTQLAFRGIEEVPKSVTIAHSDPEKFANALMDSLRNDRTSSAFTDGRRWHESRQRVFDSRISESIRLLQLNRKGVQGSM